MDAMDFSSAVRGKAVPDQAKRGKATQSSAGESIHDERPGQWSVPALHVKQVDVNKRSIRVLASTPDLDRHGERVLPEAFKNTVAEYMKNSVVLAAHRHSLDSGEPPVVGSVTNMWINREGLWAVIAFAESDLGEKYWRLYRDGHMKAASIGFIPLAWSDERSEDGQYVRTYTDLELLEISLVPVPSNREALVKGKSGKQAFVERKKQEREDARLEAEVEALISDDDCKEFGDAILLGEYESGGEIIDEKGAFVKLVSGERTSSFAQLVER